MAASPTATIRFLADSMVGKLARWLRLLGHDVRYERCLEDSLLVTDAAEEGRVVLTRDRKLVERRAYEQITFEMASESLFQEIYATKMEAEFRVWIDEIRSHLYIKRRSHFAETARLPDTPRSYGP